MTRIFEDAEGNEIPDIEYRLTPVAVIRALIDNGTLTADDIESASNYRILDVTEQREQNRLAREAAEEAERKAEAEALKNRPQEVKAAANEFVADPAPEQE